MALLRVLHRIRRRLLMELLEPVPEPPPPRARVGGTETITPAEKNGEVTLRVLSLNAWGLPVAPKVTQRAAEIASAIESGGFDVVVLQEIWHRRERNLLITRAAHAGLGFYHYFNPAIGFPVPLGHDSFGTGLLVLSRYPLDRVLYHSFALSGRPYALHEADFVANKGVGLLRVQTPAGPVDLYVTHLLANYNALGAPGPGDAYLPHRVGQAYELARFIEATSRSPFTIVCGDFNSPSDSLELRVPREILQLRDAFTDANAHDGLTFATADNKYSFGDHPMRMDYVLYKTTRAAAGSAPAWQLVESDVFKGFFTDERGETTPLSDHFGVKAEFVFGPRRPHACDPQQSDADESGVGAASSSASSSLSPTATELANSVASNCRTTTCVHCDDVEGTEDVATTSPLLVQVLEEVQSVILDGRTQAIARRTGHLRRSGACFAAVLAIVVARLLLPTRSTTSWSGVVGLLLAAVGVCEYILAFFFVTLECSTFTELLNQVRLHLQAEQAITAGAL